MPLKTNVTGDGNDPNYNMRIEVVDDPGPGGEIGYKAHVVHLADGKEFKATGDPEPAADIFVEGPMITAIWFNQEITTTPKEFFVPLKRKVQGGTVQALAWDPYKGAMASDWVVLP